MFDLIFSLPGLALVCVCAYFAAGAVLALGQISTQAREVGQVFYWDWVAWCLILGPASRIHAAVGAALDFTRENFQSVGVEHLNGLRPAPWLRPIISWAQLIVLAAVTIAAGAAPVVFFGLAWSIIAMAVALYVTARITGGGMEGGFATLALWIFLIIGWALGLLIGLFT